MTKVSMPNTTSQEEIDLNLQSLVEKGRAQLDPQTWDAIAEAMNAVQEPDASYSVSTSFIGTE